MKKVLVMVMLVLLIGFVAAHGFLGSREVSFRGGLNYEFRNNDRWAPRTFDSWGTRNVKFAGAVNRNNPYIVWRH